MNVILPNGNTFVAGNDVSIQCDVRGYPPPYVTWNKDDVEIRESQRIRISGKNNNSLHSFNVAENCKFYPILKRFVFFLLLFAEANTLTIYGITTDDSGTYKCTAQNRFNSAFQSQQINVEGIVNFHIDFV